MTRGDVAVVIATSGAVLAFDQRSKRRTFVEVRRNDLDDCATPGRGRFDFNDRHVISPP
jgi:hypothetical protein